MPVKRPVSAVPERSGLQRAGETCAFDQDSRSGVRRRRSGIVEEGVVAGLAQHHHRRVAAGARVREPVVRHAIAGRLLDFSSRTRCCRRRSRYCCGSGRSGGPRQTEYGQGYSAGRIPHPRRDRPRSLDLSHGILGSARVLSTRRRCGSPKRESLPRRRSLAGLARAGISAWPRPTSCPVVVGIRARPN